MLLTTSIAVPATLVSARAASAAGPAQPGDIQSVAGNGTAGASGDGSSSLAAELSSPFGTAVEAEGDLYIADEANNRVQEIPNSTGTQWGISMTAGDIYTVAGSSSGTAGVTGDGGVASSSLLRSPTGLTFDSSGDLFVADAGNNRVQEIAAASKTQWGIAMTAGDIYTVAGSSSGTAGSSGNGSPATGALLSDPTGISVDASNDLFVADAGNNRVQEIAAASKTQWGIAMTAGDIYTVAGSPSGTSGSSGDGGRATSALLASPEGITTDPSGDLYIADEANNRVQEIPSSTSTQWGIAMTAGDIYTVAGSSSGTSGFSGDGGVASGALLDEPTSVALDSSGDLYIADSANNRVEEVLAANGSAWGVSVSADDIYTIAGSPVGKAGAAGDGGVAETSLLNDPTGVTIDTEGDVVIADRANEKIREVTPASTAQSTASIGDIETEIGDATAGSSGDGGEATRSSLEDPWGVATDAAGDVYIADTTNNRVQEFAATTHTQWGIAMTGGDVYTIAGSATGSSGSSGDAGAATAALLHSPTGVALDSLGDLYIADSANNRVQEVAATTRTQWGVSMTANDVYTVAGSAIGSSGNSGDGGAATSALLHTPDGVATDSSGDLYVADSGNNRIQEVAAATGAQWGVSMAANDVYTVAGNSGGTPGLLGDGGAATSGYLHAPYGIAIDAKGDLYIADTANCRIQEVAVVTGTQWGVSMTANRVYTVAGSATGSSGSSGNGGAATSAKLKDPYGVALDASGDLFVADESNDRIQEVASSSGTHFSQSMSANDVYTVAGSATGSSGFSGDGGSATSALLDLPEGVAVTPGGSLYVTDSSNSRVREILATTAPAYVATTGDIYTVAGNGTFGSTGNNGQASAYEFRYPTGVVLDTGGDLYIADYQHNRVEELAGSTHTQWGIAMTAGNVYDVAGSASGTSGTSGDGGSATSSLLDDPTHLALDASGDLFIADNGNNRVQEVAATTHTQWGISMTANDIYTVAGSSSGTSGITGDSGAATSSYLSGPQGLTLDATGDLFISDAANNRVQEVAATTHTQWGISMTANDIYTVAGSSSGTSGTSGDGGAATSGGLYTPQGLTLDSDGDLYIADGTNNRVQEVPAVSQTAWGISMTAGDVYTVAGSSGGAAGHSGDGGVATSALLSAVEDVALDPSGDLYIADGGNARIQEVAAVTGTQWKQSMTAGDIYTVAGVATGTTGYGGDGGPVGSSILDLPNALALDTSGDLYIADEGNDVVREVVAASSVDAGGGPTLPKETSGGGNPSEALVGTQPSTAVDTGGTGASINSATGELDVNVTDDSIPGRGESLEFDRTYSSTEASSFSSSFGYGWTDSYNMTIQSSPNDPGVEDVIQENGSATPFTQNSAGNWVAPSRVQATLVESGGTWTFTRDANEIFTFNSSGQLTSESDLDGHTTSLAYTTYDGAPVLATVTDPAGRTLTFSYEVVSGYVVVEEITDPGSRTVQYGYDGSGDLTSVTDVGGGVTTYNYDSEHRLVSIENPLGGTSKFTYNNADQVVTESDPMNRVTTWTYNEDTTGTGTTTITDPLGIVTLQSYTDGELTAQTNADGTASASTTSYGYYPNTAGVKTVTDPDGRVTTYVYDANANLLAETNALGATTSYAYNVLDEAVAMTTPLGETTTYTYDAKGNLLSTSEPLSSGTLATTTNTYGPSSSCPGATTYDVTSVEDALGNVTSYCYDTDGDVSASTDPDGNETTYTYNALGEKTSMVSPRGNVLGGTPANFTTSYTYDAYGNLTETTDPLGHSTQATYDDVGDELTSTDANSNVTTYTYDADHELVGVAEPGGSCAPTPSLCTSYTYDADGNKLTETDANGHTTSYAYDLLGRLTSVTDPNSHTTQYTYDADGNKLTETDPDGDVTKYTYNAANELATETQGYGTSAATTETFAYDADGNTTSDTDGASNVTSYSYNALNELTSTTDAMSNTTSYTYNADGQLSTTTNPNGQVATDSYYLNGQLEETTYSDGVTHAVTYAYDPNGDLVSMVDASGTSTYTYDDADRLSSYENGAGASVAYGYDGAGNVTSLTYPNADVVSYHYNALEQMNWVKDWNANETQFGYDADGDLTSITYPNGITTADTYDPADQLSSITDTNTLTSSTVASMSYTRDNANLITGETDTGLPSAPSTFSYNALHELTAAGSSSFTYNAADDLTTGPGAATQAFNADDETCWSGSGSGACGAPPTGATTYGYSNEGNRTSSTSSSGTSYSYNYNESNELTAVTPSLGTATSYVYDGNGLLQSETTGATTNFTWNVEGSFPLLLEDGTNYYVFGPSDTPIEQISVTGGATSYLLSDQLGSVRAITNTSGTVTGTFSYDAWGNLVGSTGSAATPFGFAGGYLDAASGLYYFRARFYDSTTGQWMSLDPKVATTLQPYQYVGNDPLNSEDPLGLQGSSGLVESQDYRNAVAKKCDGHPERDGCKGLDVIADATKAIEVAGIVGCIAATEGTCAAIVASASLAADTTENFLGKGGLAGKAKNEGGILVQTGLLLIPDVGSEEIIEDFRGADISSSAVVERPIPLTRAQIAFLNSHTAVIKAACVLFCPR